MRKRLFLSALLLLGALLAHAPARAWTPTARGTPALAAGFLAGLALHEGAHWGAVLSTGEKPRWHGLSIVYDTDRMNAREALFSASAGTLSNWLTSEAALSLTNDDPGDFAAGVVLSEVLTAAAYVSVLYGHDEGDVEGMARASGVSRAWIAASMALPAALDAWRLLAAPADPAWGRVLPWASRVAKGAGLVWVVSF